MSTRPRRRFLLGAAATLALITPLAFTLPAAADPNNNTPAKLTKAVTLDGVMKHVDALQDISDEHGDRAAGRPGFQASRDYVVNKLKAAGYKPRVQTFQFPQFEENSELQQLSPDATTYVEGVDFIRNSFTPTFKGDITADVSTVGVVLPPGPAPNSNTSGCEAIDFAAFVTGSIALIQRGSCPFSQKVTNAQNAGATGVILFNEGQPGRTGLVNVVGDTPGLNIPVVFATFDVGNQLASDGPRTARVKVDFVEYERTTWNVIAESEDGNPRSVVMAGAHLDSVQDGPGLNDNGSASAALLETAVQIAKVKTTNRLRFAWWGAEEEGLLGSEHYVANLPQAEQDKIALYLNFDMIASPNYMLGVYDGDNSGGTAPPGFIPRGSAQIEDVFEKFYADRGKAFNDTEFSGRSDYGPFIAVGIPAGGLFTGAEGVKTAAQAADYGGVAGAAYDPCYHQPCDSDDPVTDGGDAALYAQLDDAYDLRGNVNAEALDVNSDAIATAVITFAFDTSTANAAPVAAQTRRSVTSADTLSRSAS